MLLPRVRRFPHIIKPAYLALQALIPLSYAFLLFRVMSERSNLFPHSGRGGLVLRYVQMSHAAPRPLSSLFCISPFFSLLLPSHRKAYETAIFSVPAGSRGASVLLSLALGSVIDRHGPHLEDRSRNLRCHAILLWSSAPTSPVMIRTDVRN